MGLLDLFKKQNPYAAKKALVNAVARSDALSQQGDKENALKVLLEYKDLGWDDGNYIMNIAYACYYAGHHPEAVEYNKRAAELNPTNGRIQINMGRAYYELSKLDQAADCYARAMRLIEEHPQSNEKADHPVACAWYGLCIALLGKKEEAEPFFQKAEAEGYQKVAQMRQIIESVEARRRAKAAAAANAAGGGMNGNAGAGAKAGAAGEGRRVNIDATGPDSPDVPQMRELFQELADVIAETIPEKWSTVYFYGEVLPDSREFYFFFKRPADGELVYSHYIPKKCNVDERIYRKQFMKTVRCLEKLHKEYADHFEKVWTNFTLVLDRDGKFRLSYDYEDVLNCGYNGIERQKIWMYVVMGVEPKGEEGKALIQRYLKSKGISGRKLQIAKFENGSEELVDAFEKKYALSLDEEYRSFLIKYNGGDTPETSVKCKDFSSDLRCLYGLQAKKNVEDEMDTPVWQEKKCIPIGEDSFGNYYAIGTAESEKGNIFFCDHEKGFALKKLADSLGLFVALCKSEEVDPRTMRTPEEREAEMIAEGKATNITDGLREIWKQEYEKYKDMKREEVVITLKVGE